MNTKKTSRVTFNNSHKDIITKTVIKKLGLKDKFELNDRMEGEMFLDKHLRRVLSCLVVEQEFSLKLTYKDKPLRCIDEFKHQEIRYKVVFPNLYGMVNILGNNFDDLIVVNIDGNYSSGFIQKIISRDILSKKHDFKKGKLLSIKNSEI